MILISLIFIVFYLILYIFYKLLTKNLDYWKKRNVPHPRPRLLFGNYMDYILMRKCAPEVASEICDQFPDEPYVGVFYGTEPALIIKDPSILKLVLSKDFYYFSGREITDYAHREPITKNLFFNSGDEWKVLRQNLTPLFTSAKLKKMFPLIQNCNKELETFLKEETRISETINARSFFARYAMECIINCAFGINANTMKKNIDNNIFIIVAHKIFISNFMRGFKMACRAMWPALFYGLGFELFDEKILTFFRTISTGVFKNRAEEESTRNDFVDLILNWNKEKYITGDSLSNMKTGDKKLASIEVDEELLLAQSILIFAAGFETTSTATSFLLYELAKNEKALAKVIEEVDAYFEKHNGIIEYECVNELPYIEACIDEALRLYPVLGVVTREVVDDYVLPTGLRLKKGDRIHIPVQHLHMNPDYFEDPEAFRPERFLGDEKAKIKPFTFLPFGEGPRICIGLRFARMVLYPQLLTVFKNYRIELAESTPLSLEFNPASIVTQSTIDVKIKCIAR